MTTTRAASKTTAAAAALIAALALAGCGTDDPVTDPPGTLAPATSTPLNKALQWQPEAEAAVRTYLDVYGRAYQRPQAFRMREFDSVTINPIRTGIKKEIRAVRANNVRVVGRPRLLWMKLVGSNVSASPPTVDIRICLDGSTAEYYEFGKRIPNAGSATGETYRVSRIGNRMIVSDLFDRATPTSKPCTQEA